MGIVTKSMETNHANIAKIMWGRVNINGWSKSMLGGRLVAYIAFCVSPHFFILHLMEMHRRRIDEMLNSGTTVDIIVIRRE